MYKQFLLDIGTEKQYDLFQIKFTGNFAVDLTNIEEVML